MKDSYFDSPHGLSNRWNISSVADVAKLSYVCMKIAMFRKIVCTPKLETRANNKAKTKYVWKTTNKMLGSRLDPGTGKFLAKNDWVKGCKTGITQAAGPCFAGYFERTCLSGHPTLEQQTEVMQHIIVIVLHTKTME